MNSLRGLREQGQSAWYDAIQRRLVWTGELYRLVQEDGVRGVVTAPVQFEEAIVGSPDYSPALAALVAEGLDAAGCYEQLAVADVQWACDILRPVYDESDGRDGYCCLGVSPHYAHDAVTTIEEAGRLWELVGRDNLMVNVPATQAGLTSIAELIGQGIHVNATLLFSAERAGEVFDAYLTGIEALIRAGGDPSAVASTASVFVSRIDSMVDGLLDARTDEADEAERVAVAAVRGRSALATAQRVHATFQDRLASERWAAVAAEGARPQRLMWASTSTKDPTFDALRYVEALVMPDTVVALQPSTYAELTARGAVRDKVHDDLPDPEASLGALSDLGVDLEAVVADLEESGVAATVDAYDRLMGALQRARATLMAEAQPAFEARLGALSPAVDEVLTGLEDEGFVRRLWARDGTLFADGEGVEAAEQRLGWLDVVDVMDDFLDALTDLQDQLEAEQVESVAILADATVSGAAEVFAQTFGQLDGSPELLVLDSPIPAQIRALESDATTEETVFVVASKTGRPPEPAAFDAYFYEQVGTPAQFIVVTDPGSLLAERAADADYLSIFESDPELAGPYSALSPFGFVPAAAMGLDVEELVDRAQLMVASCSEAVPPGENPGVWLGATLGAMAQAGRNKLTLIASPMLRPLAVWIGQLVAMSTGKNGQGIVPVQEASLASPDGYGADRLFVYLTIEDDDEPEHKARLGQLDALEAAGHPLLVCTMTDPRDIVQEMFRWQMASATAAHVLGVNPFDHPAVDEGVSQADDLVAAHARDGQRPQAEGWSPVVKVPDLTVMAQAAHHSALTAAGPDVASVLQAHLRTVSAGGYVALVAFFDPSDAQETAMGGLRSAVSEMTAAPVIVDAGPRSAYTTGQLYKDGPEGGVYVYLTSDDAEDIAIPGSGRTFGLLKEAQQAAELVGLSSRGRRALQLHLRADVDAGLATLTEALKGR